MLSEKYYFVGITEEMDLSVCLLSIRMGKPLRWRRYLIRKPISKEAPDFEMTPKTVSMLSEALVSDSVGIDVGIVTGTPVGIGIDSEANVACPIVVAC